MAIVPYRSSSLVPYSPKRIQNYPTEYFSGVDTSIFFEDTYIDEVIDFQFQLQEKVLPIYSYASYSPNTIVHGTRLITGTFTINMRGADYLHEMLYQDVSSSLGPRFNRVLPQVVDPKNPVVQGPIAMPDPTTDPDGFIQWTESMRQQYWNIIEKTSSIDDTDLSSSPYFINNDFKILLIYGDIDTIDISRNRDQIRTIEGVHPFAVAQTVDTSGQNIQEVWSFVARDMNGFNRARSNPSNYLQDDIYSTGKPSFTAG